MNHQEQLEFKIGEGEEPATVELTQGENGVEAKILDQEEPPQIEQEDEVPAQQTAQQQGEELEGYSEKVKKRIDKMTARLREAQRREQAALDYAKKVQEQAQQLQQQFVQTDTARLGEAKSRIETQAVALKQIMKKAREEGDVDTEQEAQERLMALQLEQARVAEAERQRQASAAALQQQTQQQQTYQQQQVQQNYQQPPQQPVYDPRAEQWAEENEWFGRDVAMTHAVKGIHTQLIMVEKFDPTTDAYYDELDRRMREAFPHKFQETNAVQQTNTRANRPVQTVAPATRSSGVNNVARRSVKLTPSQVAIAKKLGVPLEEYAKYVKE